MGARRTVALIGMGILAVTLSGCTAPPPSEMQAVPPSAKATASPAAPTPAAPSSPVPSSAPAVDTGPCAGSATARPVTDPAEPEQLGGKTLTYPIDRGLFETASGEAVLNADGTPVAYRVAPGDAFSTIAARFCVSEDWLQIVNHARRDNDALYAGDTLNLDPHTIYSVGDQNGVVADNAFPDWFTLPPQR